jgi:hypothetical protein
MVFMFYADAVGWRWMAWAWGVACGGEGSRWKIVKCDGSVMNHQSDGLILSMDHVYHFLGDSFLV